MLRTETESDQRRRADFPIVRQLLIGLELFHGGYGIIAPFAVDIAFEVAFIGERLLNFFIARRVRMGLIGGPTFFGARYAAVIGSSALMRRLGWWSSW